MTSTRSSGLPHLVGLSGPTNLRLNRMDLPCSQCIPLIACRRYEPRKHPSMLANDASWDSAFPFEGQGRLLRSRSISGLFSRSLHSGLQPPCLRFAVAVTGHHARLGTRLLAKLCRGRHSRRLGYMRFQGATLHRSGRAPLCIRLLPRVPDGETLIGPGVKDSRLWEPVVGQLLHSIPGEAAFLGQSPGMPPRPAGRRARVGN